MGTSKGAFGAAFGISSNGYTAPSRNAICTMRTRLLRRVENIFETIIWNFRLLVLVPVIFSLLSSVQFFAIGTWDIWAGLRLEFDPADPEGEITTNIVSYVIGGIDYYLIGIVLLIFAFGIYELLSLKSMLDLNMRSRFFRASH